MIATQETEKELGQVANDHNYYSDLQNEHSSFEKLII
jgi:hypothetical protein